jgi:hypothetical protein
MLGGGERVDRIVVPAKLSMELKSWCIPAEAEQPVKGVLNTMGIAAIGMQYGFHDWSVLRHGLLIQFL